MKVRVIALILLSILLPLLILGLMTVPKETPSEPLEGKPIELNGILVLSFGESNEIYSEWVSRLEKSGAEVKPFQLPEIPEPPTDRNDSFAEEPLLPESDLLFFKTEWLSERVNDVRLHRVFKEAVRKGIPLAAAGPDTSKFFDVLNKAGIYEFPEEANPASFDPPLVGLKVTQRTYEGCPYPYKSFLYSNTKDVDVLFKALANWLRS